MPHPRRDPAKVGLLRKDEQKRIYLLRMLSSTAKTASSALIFVCISLE
jgi:hypothetical protein